MRVQLRTTQAGDPFSRRNVRRIYAIAFSLVNLSIMKNDRAKAIRYSTLTASCHALGCQPGELLSVDRSNG